MSSATQINLADPINIKGQLQAARAIYEAKNEQLKSLYQEVEHLRAIVEHMAAMVGERFEPVAAEPAPGASRRSASPAQDEAIAVIAKHRRPMRPAEVARELDKDINAVGAALWAAEKNGKVRKLGPGLYAPLDYIPPPDTLLAPNGGVDKK